MSDQIVYIQDDGAPARTVARIEQALRAEGIARAPRLAGAGAVLQILSDVENTVALPHPGPKLVVLAHPPTDPVQQCWRLMRSGANDVLVWQGAETATDIAARLARWGMIADLVLATREQAGAIGASPAWCDAMGLICESVRFGSAPLLIQGQTGTGKEVAARVASSAAECPRDKVSIVDCGSVARDLIGSELFGHERGAFTGAHTERTGAVAEADDGILFLDEIGELPLDVQPFFLRLLQEGTYRRLGGTKWRKSRFRLIAATNRDLSEEVAKGRFREDLYHRIAAVTVTLPRLVDRPDDILPLALHFLDEALGQSAGNVSLDPAVRNHLMSREYPGNVRELRQICQRLATGLSGTTVSIGDLVRALPDCTDRAVASGRSFRTAIVAAVDAGATLADIKSRSADAAIEYALALANGSTQKAAKRLGVTARALQMRRSSATSSTA